MPLVRLQTKRWPPNRLRLNYQVSTAKTLRFFRVKLVQNGIVIEINLRADWAPPKGARINFDLLWKSWQLHTAGRVEERAGSICSSRHISRRELTDHLPSGLPGGRLASALKAPSLVPPYLWEVEERNSTPPLRLSRTKSIGIGCANNHWSSSMSEMYGWTSYGEPHSKLRDRTRHDFHMRGEICCRTSRFSSTYTPQMTLFVLSF